MIIRKNKAFLLVEVLITVLIISASIIFINHAFTSSLRATALSNDYLNAVLLLEDKSFDIELYSFTEENSSFSGEEKYRDRTFYWEQQALPLDRSDFRDGYGEEEDIGLQRLKFLLRWKRRNVERDIDILTYTQIAEE